MMETIRFYSITNCNLRIQYIRIKTLLPFRRLYSSLLRNALNIFFCLAASRPILEVLSLYRSQFSYMSITSRTTWSTELYTRERILTLWRRIFCVCKGKQTMMMVNPPDSRPINGILNHFEVIWSICETHRFGEDVLLGVDLVGV